ncbi:TRAP transporter substrate-binding protein [Sulfurirhabdus autotrophica]|uniref:TRAP-type mannitol/chloroaromatic compound transport system substrate-binding protein n=1 Tax=Sulfurirhabdus autotrophica TaxID=1706046 RepID=A0A4R3XVW0_9PROT|nr:TRAP transporter substrate-binding protein [Sulfurirhabdus autotrophica]TCV82358.1 TRAP-type mannitol/chloroaromatic compound transport system substrate-binding protein [Sulfurirhabdus autotrophica]
MQRRSFLKKAGISLATGASVVAVPALAKEEALPEIQWRMASSFPKSLDTIYGAAETLSNRVSKLTQGKFQIRVFAGGELVPGLQVLDAVSQNTVQCGHTASYYYVGKNKAFAFDTALPFGLTARQQNAWFYFGGGLQLMRELFKGYGLINFPGGNTGTQMGGWFRKEIKNLADLKGLKMRIPGIGGEIMSKLGVVPQSLPGADVYPSLEKGTIDAAEWVGPYDDEKLGLYKVAKHYYYPGFWEGSANLSFIVNQKEWDKLPPLYQEAFEVAAAEANLIMLAEYDAKNPAALGRLLKGGAKLHPFPKDVMEAALKEANKLYNEEAAKNPAFNKIYASWKRFRNDEFQWFRVAEATYANFTFNNVK